ncbi:MAG: recombination regulator RecX [Endomicrobium sp.]|jgi:regulatory protein|nr:recombination regulator RecX [Endomicrobium sp.]
MKIIKIEKMRLVKNKFRLFFDDGKKLLFFADTVVKFGLKTGLDISKDDYKEIVIYDRSNRIISDALVLVSRRSYSSKGLETKLIEKGYELEEVVKAVKRLRELNYINDEEFSKVRAANLLKKGKGEFVIKAELEKQGVEKSVIADTLKSIKTEVEPYERIIRILQTKFKNFSEKNKNETRRVAAFFLRRGFSPEDIAKALRNHKNIFLE